MFALLSIFPSFWGSFNLTIQYLGWRKASTVQGCNCKLSKVRATRHFDVIFILFLRHSDTHGIGRQYAQSAGKCTKSSFPHKVLFPLRAKLVQFEPFLTFVKVWTAAAPDRLLLLW